MGDARRITHVISTLGFRARGIDGEAHTEVFARTVVVRALLYLGLQRRLL